MTGWNNPWYKVFSFNTTIRNPKRNVEFLSVLKDFDWLVLDKSTQLKIYRELIRKWVYRLTNVSNSIKNKYRDEIPLTDEEIDILIADNPQETWNEWRVMTQIRAIKDIWFISFNEIKYQTYLMKISELWNQLLSWWDSEIIYTKALIGCHAMNPQRNTIYNEARPFLNTLFVLNEINKKEWNNKWILWHEFWAFILSMKDCNYKATAKEILNYRENYGAEKDKQILESFLYNVRKVNKIWFDSIFKDYADDVFRKFDMTWLLTKSWFKDNTYIRFNEFNLSKVEAILDKYKDYDFQEFNNPDEYVKYLSEIVIPWELSEEVKQTIIVKQKKELNVEIDESLSSDDQLKELNHLYNSIIFKNYVDDDSLDIELIKKELFILCTNTKEKSAFDDIPEPVRLEWLIAILTAHIYWSEYVRPNLLFDSSWKPKSFAPWWIADIEFISDKLYCLIEVTLMKDYKQQMNSETTSVSDHLDKLSTSKRKCSLLLAPYIHSRVVRYFQFESKDYWLSIIALSILLYLKNIEKHTSIDDFISMIDVYSEYLNSLNDKEYTDIVNNIW